MDGCAFNLTTSDSSVALSDTGLKGILGASAVNVNGGKTLPSWATKPSWLRLCARR